MLVVQLKFIQLYKMQKIVVSIYLVLMGRSSIPAHMLS